MRDIQLYSVNFIVLVVFSAVAIYTDYRYGKIYNWLNFSTLLIGVIMALYQGNVFSSILGIIIGFIMMFPFFISGGMGAGDVKFAMATGALVGGRFLLIAFAGAGVLILLYATLKRLGIIKLVWKGIKDFGDILKSMVKYILTIMKISAVSGRVFVPAGVEKRSENKKMLHRIKYGIFLGFSNIIISIYLIIEQGGIK